jgi:hypothetical protein
VYNRSSGGARRELAEPPRGALHDAERSPPGFCRSDRNLTERTRDAAGVDSLPEGDDGEEEAIIMAKKGIILAGGAR